MWDGHDGMGWWMLFGSIWFVILWGLIIWAVYTVVSRLGGGQSSQPPREESALDIAKRRYARGEISKEEYDRLRADLS
jgi:putative membrane protein